MSFKLDDQKDYNYNEAPTESEKSIQEMKFEDGGNKKFADPSVKRTLKAIGLAIYLLVTGYFAYRTVQDAKNFLGGSKEPSITESWNDLTNEMKKAIREGKSREEVREIPIKHGTLLTYNYSNELIDKLIVEIQEEDKAKGRANEIAILKAEEATRVIREAAVNGASQKELEKIAAEYGITLDPNYKANFDNYRANLSVLRDVKQSKSLSEILEQLNEAALNGASQRELEEMAKESGITLDPNYASNIRRAANAEELTISQNTSNIKKLTMFTTINGVGRGFGILEDYDVPLYNKQTGRVMVLRPTTNEEIKDLITGETVDRKEYIGSSPFSIRKLIADGALKGYWLSEGNYKFDATDLAETVTYLLGKNETKEETPKYNNVEWIKYNGVGIHDAPWDNREINPGHFAPDEREEIERQMEEMHKQEAERQMEEMHRQEMEEMQRQEMEKMQRQETIKDMPESSQLHAYDLRIFVNDGGSLKTYKLDEELDTPLYNKQTGRVMILRPMQKDCVKDLLTGGYVEQKDYYGSSPVNIYKLVDDGSLPGRMHTGNCFEFQADDYIETVVNCFRQEEQKVPGV